MKEKRSERLKSEIQKLVYEILKNKIKNPEITEMFSVSAVELSTDLEYANVYVSVFSMDNARKEKTFNAIVESAPQVRRNLASMMKIRTVPQIIFFMDSSAAYAEKIDRIISGFTYGENNDDN